jgi:DNA mismatch repair ATPase MutS
MLKGLEDVSRLAQRLTLGRGESDDLLGIRKAIVGWSQLCQRLRIEREFDIQRDPSAIEGWRNMNLLLSHTSDLNHLAKQIESAVDPYDFDRKERIATGIGENNDDEQVDVDSVQVFGRPPYGGRWKIKPE